MPGQAAGTAVDWMAVAQPVGQRAAFPLRVAVYSQIARAIRAGAPAPGEVLPNEADLCAAFSVSRTVMREALILLEEDGLIRSQRGVGRFVADVLPSIGLEQLQPVETMLGRSGSDIEIRSLKREQEQLTEFTGRGLNLAENASAWIWESVIVRDGRPIALSQEWVPAGAYLDGIDARLSARVSDASTRGSLLAVLVDQLPSRLGPGTCELTVSSAGAERGHPLHASASSPILLLTQIIPCDQQPLYIAKHMLSPEAGHLTVVQSAQL